MKGFESIYGDDNTILATEDLVRQKQQQKHLLLKDVLTVEYIKNQKQTSYLYKKQASTYIDRNGYFDTQGIRWSGYMARQRIADLLPFDFAIMHTP